ncbi:MAG: cytochrome P460 family protein [Deferrisomatales bacterium]
MNPHSVRRTLTLLAPLAVLAAAVAAGDRPTAVTGVALPEGYRDWTAVAPSYRTDRGHIRMMLANPTMTQAYRAGTLPFPDGSSIAKLVYQAAQTPEWDGALVPGKVVIVEIMIKDSRKYAEDGGWGFGRFGPDHRPVGDAELYRTCFPCHEANVVDQDYVFTRWAR